MDRLPEGSMDLVAAYLGEPDIKLLESSILLRFRMLSALRAVAVWSKAWYQHWYDCECDIAFHH